MHTPTANPDLRQQLDEAALRLRRAAAARTPCAPVRDILPADDVDAAYRVQDINTEQRLTGGARLVGRKIGLTSAAVQRQLGVDRPDYGMLFADMVVPDDGEIEASRLLQPRAEAEIAFVLGRDLTEAQLTIADVMRAVDYAVAAIEIVDSRIAGWDIGIVDTIADNASSGCFVLGMLPRRLDQIDLAACGMELRRNGRIAAVGSGAACLGNPLAAAMWLATTMVACGRPLLAGDIVLSGALGPMVPLSCGDIIEAGVAGFGKTRVHYRLTEAV